MSDPTTAPAATQECSACGGYQPSCPVCHPDDSYERHERAAGRAPAAAGQTQGEAPQWDAPGNWRVGDDTEETWYLGPTVILSSSGPNGNACVAAEVNRHLPDAESLALRMVAGLNAAPPPAPEPVGEHLERLLSVWERAEPRDTPLIEEKEHVMLRVCANEVRAAIRRDAAAPAAQAQGSEGLEAVAQLLWERFATGAEAWDDLSDRRKEGWLANAREVAALLSRAAPAPEGEG